ncbi:MAG: VC0807 family protein [Streptosporangiaceae bacterium]
MSPRRQLATFGFDVGAPIALYYVLYGAGVSNLVALGAGAVLPALAAIYQLITKRRTDTVGLFVVATMAFSIVVSVIAHNPRFLLAKDGLITGLWGVWFLASLRARRPAAFIFARPLMEGRKIFAARSWDALWEAEPAFRRIWRVASVMWGVGFLADAATRVVMSYTLPIAVVPGLSGALWPVTFVVLQIISNVYYQLAGLNRILGARWLPRAAPTRPGADPLGPRHTPPVPTRPHAAATRPRPQQALSGPPETMADRAPARPGTEAGEREAARPDSPGRRCDELPLPLPPGMRTQQSPQPGPHADQ